MKTIVAAVLVGLLPSTVSAGDHDTSCVAWVQKIVDGDADACADLCPQAAEFDHYDYRNGLAAAYRSEKDLSAFLSYLDRSSIIGSGAEAHACSVRALLERWGDNTFARALSRQSAHVKDQAIGLLDYTGIPNFRQRYPKTYLLAAHE